MTTRFDDRSERRLVGVHSELVRVIRASAEDYCVNGRSFVVTEGVRTVERQAELLKAGATQVMYSRHLTGHAVDLAVKLDGQVRWDWPLYTDLGQHVKLTAARLGVKIIWGGDWVTLRDGPHFELDKAVYPVQSYHV